MYRATIVLGLSVSLVALAMIAQAADDKESKQHQGLVVSAMEGKLVMTDTAGAGQHSHEIAANTKITIDDRPANLEELRAGDKITVTTNADNKVTAIAATRTPAL